MHKNLFLSLIILSTLISVNTAIADLEQAVNQESSVTNTEKIPSPEPMAEIENAVSLPDNAMAHPNNAMTLPESPLETPKPSVEPEPVAGEMKKAVKAVEVKGNKSIGLTTILAKVKTRVAQDYSPTMISDDLKRLYNTGYFSDVSVDRQDFEGGYKVIFVVVEKEIVDQITFTKLKFLSQNAILSKIKTAKGKFLDNKTLNDDIRTIEELYAKKGLTQVKVKVETQRDDITNKVTIHFVIKEGVQVKIKRIYFDGNANYKSRRMIKVIKSRYAWLFNSGYLKSETLDEDMERIKSFYEKEGYIDAIASYDVEEISDSKRIVKIHIHEGKRYFVESITIVGNAVIAKDRVASAMTEIKEKGVFSRDKLSVDISNIRSLYFDEGYIFVNVKESTALNSETGKVEVRLDLEEGHLAYVNQVKIQGNERTRDIVIRRELRLYPGDRFDGGKLRRSKERLRNLGYFDDINYDIEDTDVPEKKNLVVAVKEAKTGSFSFGAGYSTVDQFVGFAEIEQKNFDFANWPTFTGGGQDLSLRFENGSTRSDSRISFTEPWIFDHPVSGGFDAYLTKHDKQSSVGYAYDERRIGGDLRVGRRFGEYYSAGATYRRENIKVGNFDSDVSTDLKAEEGSNTLSVFGVNASMDRRNSSIIPTKGLFLSGGIDVAGGVFGGDKDFYRITSRNSYNIPLPFNSTVEFRMNAGISDPFGNSNKVPIYERFFAGGSRTIRGYDERAVGPVDSTTNDPIGGESMLIGNIEYTIPIIEFVKLATFFDTGNVWSKMSDFAAGGGYKSGAGFGLRVKTPIGPVNLDYGIPFNKVPGDTGKTGKFYFSVSRGF